MPFGRFQLSGRNPDERFALLDGSGNLIGNLDLTGTSPPSNWVASSDLWSWSGSAWPDHIRIVEASPNSLPSSPPSGTRYPFAALPGSTGSYGIGGGTKWYVLKFVPSGGSGSDIGYLRHNPDTGALLWFVTDTGVLTSGCICIGEGDALELRPYTGGTATITATTVSVSPA